MEKQTMKVSRKLIDTRNDKKTPFAWDVDEKSLGEGLHELTCSQSGSKKLVLVGMAELPTTKKDIDGMDKKDILVYVRLGIQASVLSSMGNRLDDEVAKRRVSAAIAAGDTKTAQEIISDVEQNLIPMLEKIGMGITSEAKTSYVKNTYGVDYAQVIEILGIAEG